jgi:hypothetical protein
MSGLKSAPGAFTREHLEHLSNQENTTVYEQEEADDELVLPMSTVKPRLEAAHALAKEVRETFRRQSTEIGAKFAVLAERLKAVWADETMSPDQASEAKRAIAQEFAEAKKSMAVRRPPHWDDTDVRNEVLRRKPACGALTSAHVKLFEKVTASDTTALDMARIWYMIALRKKQEDGMLGDTEGKAAVSKFLMEEIKRVEATTEKKE